MNMEINNISSDGISLFLRIFGDFILNRKRDYGDCCPYIGQLFYLAKIHSLMPVLYYMLQPQCSSLAAAEPELIGKMKAEYQMGIYQSLLQENAIEELQTEFAEKNIPILFFKGAQLRLMYPEPVLRTMGDIDCLIHSQDRQTAHRVMEKLGYICHLKNETEWIYHRKNVVVELHTELGDNHVSTSFSYGDFFSDAMCHVEQEGSQLTLNYEYYFCYLIYHIAKHLCSTGAGVRMIGDIAAFVKVNGASMDWNTAQDLLRASNLMRTAHAVLALCQRWFELTPPIPLTVSAQLLETMESCIVYGGTYGFETHDRRHVYHKNFMRANTSDRKGNHLLLLIKAAMFPSKDCLAGYLPEAAEQRWLIPIAWLRRLWVICVKRRTYAQKILRPLTAENIDRIQQEALMLRDLGL